MSRILKLKQYLKLLYIIIPFVLIMGAFQVKTIRIPYRKPPLDNLAYIRVMEGDTGEDIYIKDEDMKQLIELLPDRKLINLLPSGGYGYYADFNYSDGKSTRITFYGDVEDKGVRKFVEPYFKDAYLYKMTSNLPFELLSYKKGDYFKFSDMGGLSFTGIVEIKGEDAEDLLAVLQDIKLEWVGYDNQIPNKGYTYVIQYYRKNKQLVSMILTGGDEMTYNNSYRISNTEVIAPRLIEALTFSEGQGD